MTADKIYLVGFMAAGKTSVAQDLGRRLDWRVEDVDARIEARERMLLAEAVHDEPLQLVVAAILRAGLGKFRFVRVGHQQCDMHDLPALHIYEPV